MNLPRFPYPTDISDFTDRQKALFLQITVKNLISYLKKKNSRILKLQEEIREKESRIRHLEESLQRKNRSYRTLQDKVNRLDRWR